MKSFLFIVIWLALFAGSIYWLHWQSNAKKRRRKKWRENYLKRRSSETESQPSPEPEKEEETDPCVWIDSPDPGYPDRETIDFDCQSFVDHVRQGPFLFKPVVQLGRQVSNTDSTTSFDLVWAALSPEGDWRIDIECGEPCARFKVAEIEKTPVRLKDLTDHCLMRTTISGINFGQRLEYKLYLNDELVFSATTHAPYGPETKAHRFAVIGDMGTGGSGQKRIANQIWNSRPDLMVFVGDITYRFGRAGEYMLRFFPIYNADSADSSSGAPILRSIPSFNAAGNHCMAKAHPEDVPSFDTYHDLYAYYLYWSMPLNGPVKNVGDTSIPHVVGSQNYIDDFLAIAGERFPRMANYSFDYANVHWLVLDANQYMDWTEESLRQWVEDDLKAVNPSMWKFVSFHQPPFTSNLKHKREKRMRLLCEIFQKYGVHVVFNGHSHTYERTYPLKFSLALNDDGQPIDEKGQVVGAITRDFKFDGRVNTSPDGIVYIITGAGGAPRHDEFLHKRPHLWEPFTYRFIGDRYSFTTCEVDGDELTIRQVDDQGVEVDKIVITK